MAGRYVIDFNVHGIPDEMGWTQNERPRDHRKDIMSHGNKLVAENEKDHSYDGRIA